MTTEIIHDQHAIIGLHLQRGDVDAASRIELQIEHLDRQLATHRDTRPLAQHPPSIAVLGDVALDPAVHCWVVDGDDLTVVFHRVRDPDAALVDVGDVFGDGRLARAAGSVEHDRAGGEDRDTELLS